MNPYRCMVLTVSLWIVSLSLCGCGSASDQPELGQVAGTITMDGQPLVATVVVFSPDNGRPSRGKTDAEGKYELTYIGETRGAKVGHHRVEIAPNEEGEDESEIEAATAGEDVSAPTSPVKPEKTRVPARYNTNSELEADVKAGENVFDFKLESQPAN
jgi:hypothetical protein